LGFKLALIHKAIRESSKTLVLAVDEPNLNLKQLEELVKGGSNYVGAVKIGLPYLLTHSLHQLSSLISELSNVYFLADLKLADIGDIMSVAAKEVLKAGFHGIVAHAFVGAPGALEILSDTVEELGGDLVLQTSMSHPGSINTYDRIINEVKDIVNMINPDGLIIPANKPEIIKDFRDSFGFRQIILAPGIIRYGEGPGSGISSGADAEVVGRSVLSSPDPVAALKDIKNRQKKFIKEKRAICMERL
jgi:orotidine-5'-phosphate decarboxylase